MKNIAVILAGGVGSRLWPLSTEARPKYLLPYEEGTLLSRQIKELSNLTLDKLIIVTSHHAFVEVKKQVDQSESKNIDILVEPIQKNTAPSILFAAQVIKTTYKNDCNIIIFPADSFISDYKPIEDFIKYFMDKSAHYPIISLSKIDNNPNSNFGYMLGKKVDSFTYKTSNFVEKPDKEKLEELSMLEDVYINTGIFITTIDFLFNELNLSHSGLIRSVIDSIKEDGRSLDFKSFSKIEPIAIDKALFEKTNAHFFYELQSGWSDVGSFFEYTNLLRNNSSDKKGNIIFSKDSLITQANNSFIWAKDKFVSIIGVDNILLIENEDNIFISNKKNLPDIADFQSKAKEKFYSSELSDHTNYRPWGWYKTLEETDFYKVKKICVSSGESISLQSHLHREEIWTIVKGKAEFFVDGKIDQLGEGQSVNIPKETKHYIRNNGSNDLVFIEVQLGSYLGEDDIVRYSDNYNRK